MSKLLLGVVLLSSVSCAFLSDMHITNYNYNHLNTGESVQVALEKRGSPQYKLSDGSRSMFLYRDGYIVFENNQITMKGSYEFALGEGDTLTAALRSGVSLFEIIPSLGMPLGIEGDTSRMVLKYNRGAILAKDLKVVTAVDKVYSDLIFNIDINSFTDNTADSSGAYFIAPGSEKVSPEDFQFKEVKSFLTASLSMQGYHVVDAPTQAKYLILVNYGISDPKEDIKVVSRPVYIPQYIPGKSFSFFGANGSYLGAATSRGAWTSQYAGQHTETYKTVTYSRWMNIEAIDFNHLKKTKTLKPVWKVLSSSVGSSKDLRFVLPALSYGSVSYINKDTQRELGFTIGSNALNEYIYEIKFHNSSKVFPREIAGRK